MDGKFQMREIFIFFMEMQETEVTMVLCEALISLWTEHLQLTPSP